MCCIYNSKTLFSCSIELILEGMLPYAVIGYHNVQGSKNNHVISYWSGSYLPIGILKEFVTPPRLPYVILPTIQHLFMLNLATSWVYAPQSCSFGIAIGIEKWFPTPPGTLYIILPNIQHQFVLNLGTFWVYSPKSCSWVPYYPRLNVQPWHQVFTSL